MKFYKKIYKKFIVAAIILSMVMVSSDGMIFFRRNVYAAQTFTLGTAQKLGLANSKVYAKTKSQIAVQQTKYVDAVKSIEKRRKSLSSFRWTPLLSFKFPQDPLMDEEYTWMYKPLQIQTNITNLKHKLSDTVYASREEISSLYVDIYVSQVKIKYLTELIDGFEKDKERTNALIAAGTGNANDIRKIDNSLKKYKSVLAKEERAIIVNKNKMKKLTKMDVSSHEFVNPFVTADIPRSAIDNFVKTAKERDHDFYVQKMTTSLAFSSLKMNYQLMKNHYGSKMDSLSPYISQAYNGQEIDVASFQKATDNFIEKVDRKWKGKRRILFFSFTLEWFMGDTDGSRYIEDSPYALATSAGDYIDALNDEKSAEQELEDTIRNDYEGLVTAKNAYLGMHDSNAELYEQIQKDKVKNLAGTFTMEELNDEQNELAGNGLDELDLLAAYSKLLYSYDRKTCGAVTDYLASSKASVKSSSGGKSYKTPGTEKEADDSFIDDAAEEGGDFIGGDNGKDSFLEADKIEGAYYYIESHVEDRMFAFGVSIPDDMTPKITDYELWVNDTRIGERTKTDEQIKHLTLALDNADKTVVKLYSSNKLIDICEIDSMVNRGKLNITASYKVVTQEKPRTAASYKMDINENLKTVTFKFEKSEGEPISYYLVTDSEGNALLDGEHYRIDDEFEYLSAVAGDLTKLRVQFYDNEDNFLYTGDFVANKGTVVVYPEAAE